MQMEAKKYHHESVSKLEGKVKELERKCDEQSSNFSRITYELSAMRLDASTHFRTLSAIGADGTKGLATSNGNTPEDELTKALVENRRPVPSGAEQIMHAELPRDISETSHQSLTGADKRAVAGGRRNGSKLNGQLDSAEPDVLMDNMSETFDAAILERIQQASSASSGPTCKLAVFIARYNYTPHQDSPNENPDAELPLTAGDYIYVYGDPDDDGFFEGELMNGKRGLVPSNFIERVAGIYTSSCHNRCVIALFFLSVNKILLFMHGIFKSCNSCKFGFP